MAARARHLITAAIVGQLLAAAPVWGQASSVAPGTDPAREVDAEPAPAVERIALVYSAPAECPDDAAFRSAVRARASGDWEARPGELARRITVSVAKQDEKYVAAIVFVNGDGDGATVARNLSGRVCADVVDGIALVTALAIQSRVEEALARSEPEPAQPPPAAVAVVKPAVAQNAPAPAPKSAAKPSAATRFRFGVAARVASGTAPAASFGPTVFGAVELGRARLGLSAGGLWSGSATANGVAAKYLRLSGRLDGCPYAFGTTTLAFEPCAFFEAGALHGAGEPSAGLSTTSGGWSPWLVPGVLLRLVTGFDPLVVELELGGGPPLVRERFGRIVDGQEQTTFRVPPFVVDAALGIGFRL